MLRLFVGSLAGESRLSVYQGNIYHSTKVVHEGRIETWDIERRDLSAVPRERICGAFAPEVWRILCGAGQPVFCGLEAPHHAIRLPKPSEKPPLRWLAYGSSITHADEYGHVFCAAAELGVDVLNKGMSGSCLMEPQVTEYLAHGIEWDFATLELGINMRDALSFSVDDFERRASALVQACAATKRPVFVITIFPNAATFARPDFPPRQREETFNRILRDLAKPSANVKIIEGADVLTDLRWTVGDLLHPTHYGQFQMGRRLAEILRRNLPDDHRKLIAHPSSSLTS
jgi:hypothetical protein